MVYCGGGWVLVAGAILINLRHQDLPPITSLWGIIPLSLSDLPAKRGIGDYLDVLLKICVN